MDTYKDLRLTLPEQHLKASTVMQAHHIALLDFIHQAYDLMETPRIWDITNYLKAHNRSPMSFQLRHQHCHTLLERSLFSALSLQESLPYKEMSKLQRECCYAVKLLMLTAPDHRSAVSEQYLHWLTFCLSEQIASRLRYYETEPKNLWGELHRTFLFALQHQQDNTQAYPLTNTLRATYQAIVMLAAAEPQKMDSTESQIVLQWLRRWVTPDSLWPLGRSEPDNRHFHVDLSTNRGITPRKNLKPSSLGDTVLVLDPSPLIELARSHINQLHAAPHLDDLDIGLEVDVIQVICALKKALLSWNQTYKRKEQRLETQQPVQMVIGLSYVLQIIDSDANQHPNAIEGRVINTSKGGACIELSNKDIISASVGDVISEHTEADQVLIGVIKWIKKTADGARMGIEYLHGHPKSVSTNHSDHWVNGLYLHDNSNGLLLTRAGAYQVGQHIRIVSQSKQQPVMVSVGPLQTRLGTTELFRVHRWDFNTPEPRVK